MALERRIAFNGYWSGLEHTATVTAPLVLVTAADSALAEGDEKMWAERTKGGLRRLAGSGKHREMVAGAHAVANVGLLLT